MKGHRGALAISVVGLACLMLGSSAKGNPNAERVATIGGRAVTKAAMSDFMFERYRDQYRRSLDELIDERIAREVASRAGLRVPRDKLVEVVAKEVEARRELQKDVYGEGEALEDWVERGYGIDVEEWKRTILMPRFEGILLRQRVARLEARRELRIHARLIVVSTPERAELIMRKLRAGADFSLVALKQSEDESKTLGGSLPPIARGDLAAFPIVEQKLFATPAGRLLGPLRVRVAGKSQWQIYKIVRRQDPWRLTGQPLFDALEADIAKTPVTRAEYELWRLRSRKRDDVRFFDAAGNDWRPPR